MNRAFDFVHFQSLFSSSGCAAAACEIDHLAFRSGVTRGGSYFRGSFHESAGAARHTPRRASGTRAQPCEGPVGTSFASAPSCSCPWRRFACCWPARSAHIGSTVPRWSWHSPGRGDGAGAGWAGSSGLLDRVLALGPIEHARPRHPRRPKDEAAMFAVHVRRGDPKRRESSRGGGEARRSEAREGRRRGDGGW